MSENELRAQIDSSRQKLAESLALLTNTVQPKVQASYLADDLKYKAKETTYNFATTVDDARDGDSQAMKKLLITGAVALGTIVLLVVRRKAKKSR
ncbi:hypothetical protein U6G28_02970 [Actinomycetaceae bacterium MB13-C1-2]|nr:hypothetical protein U6G28_02970 [Actinomycetaceae bacterium MB13-C1-2]